MFNVFLKGGSIGENNKNAVAAFQTKDEAKEYVKRRNKELTKGEKSYYGMRYFVKEVK